MAGNRLGPRGTFSYTSDTGEIYRLETDLNLGQAGGLTIAAEGVGVEPPKRLNPRGVWAKSTAAPIARRFVPCNVDFAGYTADAPTAITIDGEAFTTTGRVGESLSFR